MAGEGHGPALDAIVGELVEEARERGTLREDTGPYVAPPVPPGLLAFPSKAIPLDGQSPNLLVADSGHHSLAELDAMGRLVRRIGSGQRGWADGPATVAQFSEPSGLTRLPAALAERVGYDVVVADTVNHVLRGVQLSDGQVTTVAGTGRQWLPGDPEPWFVQGATAPVAPCSVPLSSPWDVAWDARRAAVIVAMAGIHQLWGFDPATGELGAVAGTRAEGLADGPADAAWLAQPSGLAPAGDKVWFVDSETSSLRVLEPGAGKAAAQGPGIARAGGSADRVRTAIGEGLFDFGLVDGKAGTALMQHPLGLALGPDGSSVLVADTYNGSLRRFDTASGELTTVATGLAEPSDVLILPSTPHDADGGHPDGSVGRDRARGSESGPTVLVVESAAHRIVEVQVAATVGIDAARGATNRPAVELQEGVVALSIPFLPAPGQKLDTRFGPSCQLAVSATPPELLRVGAGTTAELGRALVLAPGEGVLHVTARAASCDLEAENPACHVVAQDWGVPVRVAARSANRPDAADQDIELPLRG
jgi:hypothetical protein